MPLTSSPSIQSGCRRSAASGTQFDRGEGPEMHPRERGRTRRDFLVASGGTVAALAGADALLGAARALAAPGGAPVGPGGIPLARRDHPVTLPLYPDNRAIPSGRAPEKGPLQVFNWADYINPKVIKDFQKA